MKRLTRLALALSCVAAVPVVAGPALNPGVVFKLEVKATPAASATVMTATVEGPNVKMEVPAAEGQGRVDMVFRGDRKEMVMIDHSRQAFMVMDQATMKQATDQIGAAMSAVQEQLKNMPPEQRAMMEEMMKGRGMAMPAAAPVVEVRRTSERAKQSGYDAVKYEMVRDGNVQRVLWITDWSNVAGAEEARAAFEGMAAFMTELTAGLPPMMSNVTQDAFGHMKELGGFPVLTIELDEAGQPAGETRLVSATSQSVPADAFDPPAGYRQQSIGR